MRRSRKGEFAKGVNSGMRKAFFRCTYLPTLEAAEAYKIIAIKAAEKKGELWSKYKGAECIKDLQDAYFWGELEGEVAWSDEEINEVAKRAKLDVLTR